MRTLKGGNIPNRDSSDPTNFPYDRLKNKIPGVQSGTQISEETVGDLIQAAVELLRIAGITPDEVAEKKAASQIADAVGFLKPIGIVVAGYDSTFKILNSKFIAGYSANYTAVDWDPTLKVAKMKLEILKDGVTATEDLFVTCNPCDGIAVPLHPNIVCYPGMSAGKFANSSANNIYIVAPGLSAGGDPTEQNFVQRQAVSFVIYKI